jgi:NAD(P)-dependent dehydrogenase (short-subunit alcohol dehydrogenase family)
MSTSKTVVVVGGSRGIGKGVVDYFLDKNENVYYLSRTEIKNSEGVHIKADILYYTEIVEAFNRIKRLDSNIDILINCAGVNYCKPLAEIDILEWDEVLKVNLASYFVSCQEALKSMKPGGKIVNVSSIAGRNRSIVSGIHYTSSKAGIIGFTRQLAYEFGHKGININCVCPSQTMTEMLMQSMTTDEQVLLAKNIPLRRLATVREIVDPIVFLCSNGSSYIHGACIDINGGQL